MTPAGADSDVGWQRVRGLRSPRGRFPGDLGTLGPLLSRQHVATGSRRSLATLKAESVEEPYPPPHVPGLASRVLRPQFYLMLSRDTCCEVLENLYVNGDLSVKWAVYSVNQYRRCFPVQRRGSFARLGSEDSCSLPLGPCCPVYDDSLAPSPLPKKR